MTDAGCIEEAPKPAAVITSTDIGHSQLIRLLQSDPPVPQCPMPEWNYQRVAREPKVYGAQLSWTLTGVRPDLLNTLPIYGSEVREEWTKQPGQSTYEVKCSLSESVPVLVSPCLTIDDRDEGTWVPRWDNRAHFRLGVNPVQIHMPFEFTILEFNGAGRTEQWKIANGNDCKWTEDCNGRLCEFTWPWIQFWDRQVRYWRFRSNELDEYVMISESQGVLINRHVYMMLAETDSHLWIWQDGEEFVGGYEDPERMRSVEWDYYPLATPSIQAWPGYESC
jgi:hypothetical protein